MKKKRFIRQPLNRMYIVCGSTVTEPLYFTKLKSYYRKKNIQIEVLPIQSRNQSPNKLLEKAKNIINSESLEIETGDTIWCIFDYDDFDKVIQENIYLRKFKNIKKVISTRCFEIWYLQHYRYSTKVHTTTKAIEKELSHYIDKGYSKTKDYFDLLIGKHEKAIKNAKKLEEYHVKANNVHHTSNANPSTDVYKIVEFIKDF